MPCQILFDGAAGYNLGDLAMAQAAVNRLCSIRQDAEVYVVERFTDSFRRMEFTYPQRVHTTENIEIEQPLLCALNATPILWRLSSRYQALLLERFYTRLSRQCSVQNMKVYQYGRRKAVMTLGEFCSQYDALCLPGGGNLTSTFPVEHFRRCAWAACFAELGKPVILTGQQLGPFKTKQAKAALHATLRRASFVGVREPLESLRHCIDAGMAEENFAVMGDDSFGLDVTRPELVSEILARYSLEPGKFIALNLRATSYMPETSGNMTAIANSISEILQRLKMPALVVPIDLESDIQAGKHLAQLASGVKVHVLDDRNLTPSLARGILGSSAGALGTSYHFCTFTLSEGIPAICIYDGDYYTQKARGLAAFWDDKRLLCSFEQLQVPDVLHRLCDTLTDQSLKLHLRRRSREAIRVWDEYSSLAVSRLWN